MTSEPVLIQTAILAIINMLLIFGVIHWNQEQIAAVNAVVIAVLGAIVRQQVTPNRRMPQNRGTYRVEPPPVPPPSQGP